MNLGSKGAKTMLANSSSISNGNIRERRNKGEEKGQPKQSKKKAKKAFKIKQVVPHWRCAGARRPQAPDWAHLYVQAVRLAPLGVLNTRPTAQAPPGARPGALSTHLMVARDPNESGHTIWPLDHASKVSMQAHAPPCEYKATQTHPNRIGLIDQQQTG